MSGPEVEVLLATYNGERFLREQIESILGQSYGALRVTARDDGRHTVASALPPPSRRPHVTQNRPAGRPAGGDGGLLGRLRRWLGGR